MGAVGKVAIDRDGRHVWAIVRCDRLEDPARFGDECRDSKTDPIVEFGPDGKGVKRGQIVVKFSPEGKVLLTLGTPGQPGSAPDHFTSPSDVAVAPGGEIFVADGHNENGNNRIVKFSKDGAFVKAWGKSGWAPGEFHAIHAIAIDARGRVFVGDRGNNRIQIFDQDGKSLATWTQFGKPSGIFFDSKD